MSETGNIYETLMPEMKDSYSSSKDNKYKFEKLKSNLKNKKQVCPVCRKEACQCSDKE